MPSEFGIDASAFREAAGSLESRGFSKAAGRTVAYALKRAANVVRRHVRGELRPHRKTGRLASHVRTSYRGVGMDFVGKVWSGTRVAHLIAGGVRPHKIAPHKVMPIHGPGRSSPVVGFARVVQHPGFRADPYFEHGVIASTAEINQILAKSAETMASELAYRMRNKR